MPIQLTFIQTVEHEEDEETHGSSRNSRKIESLASQQAGATVCHCTV